LLLETNKRVWIGFGLSVGLIGIFLLTVDVPRMFDSIISANYWYMVPAIVLYFVSIWFRTLRWRSLLSDIKSIAATRLYPVVVIGYMANNILPMRIGELARSYYLAKRERVSTASVFTTIFVERLLDALTLLFFVSLVSIFLPLEEIFQGLSELSGLNVTFLATITSLPFIVVFGILIVFSIYTDRVQSYAMTLSKLLPRRVGIGIIGVSNRILIALIPLRKPFVLLKVFLLSVPIWLFEVGLFISIALSFGFQDLYDNYWLMVLGLILVTAIANIGSSIPAAPGGLGLFEIIARETLVLLPYLDIDRSLAGAYVLIVHSALMLPIILLGQALLIGQNVNLGSLLPSNRLDLAKPAQIQEADIVDDGEYRT